MPKVFRYRIRDAEVKRSFSLLGKNAARAAKTALIEEAEATLTASKLEVPVDKGILRSTGHVAPAVIRSGLVAVQAAYGGPAAPYALSVHENPRAGRTLGLSPGAASALTGVAAALTVAPGSLRRSRKTWAKTGKWRYLVDPFNQRHAGMAERIGTRMGGILLGSLK